VKPALGKTIRGKTTITSTNAKQTKSFQQRTARQNLSLKNHPMYTGKYTSTMEHMGFIQHVKENITENNHSSNKQRVAGKKQN